MLINASVQDVSERNTQILCLELEGKNKIQKIYQAGQKTSKCQKVMTIKSWWNGQIMAFYMNHDNVNN